MVGYLDIIADFVEEPRRAAAETRERRPWGLGILSFAAAGLSLFLAQSLSRRFLLLSPGPIGLVIACGGRVVAGVLLAGVLHLVADASGHRGSAGGLFVLLGLSDLVWTLAVPIVLVLKIFSVDNWFTILGMLFFLGWLGLRLKARSLRDTYGVGPAKAWLLLSVPYVAAAWLAMSLVFLAVAGMTLSLVRLFS